MSGEDVALIVERSRFLQQVNLDPVMEAPDFAFLVLAHKDVLEPRGRLPPAVAAVQLEPHPARRDSNGVNIEGENVALNLDGRSAASAERAPQKRKRKVTPCVQEVRCSIPASENGANGRISVFWCFQIKARRGVSRWQANTVDASFEARPEGRSSD